MNLAQLENDILAHIFANLKIPKDIYLKNINWSFYLKNSKYCFSGKMRHLSITTW